MPRGSVRGLAYGQVLLAQMAARPSSCEASLRTGVRSLLLHPSPACMFDAVLNQIRGWREGV